MGIKTRLWSCRMLERLVMAVERTAFIVGELPRQS